MSLHSFLIVVENGDFSQAPSRGPDVHASLLSIRLVRILLLSVAIHLGLSSLTLENDLDIGHDASKLQLGQMGCLEVFLCSSVVGGDVVVELLFQRSKIGHLIGGRR